MKNMFSFLRITFLFVFTTIIRISSQHQLPPKLADSVAFKAQNIGTRLSVHCEAQEGSKPLHFTWKKNNQEFKPSSNANFRYRIDSTEEDSLLVITQLAIEDTANYTCSVNNAFGTVHQTTVVIVKGFYFYILLSFLLNVWRI